MSPFPSVAAAVGALVYYSNLSFLVMAADYKKIYGLIGYPLGHSFSQDFFNKKFETERVNAEYVNFEIPTIKELKSQVLHTPELSGLNVTIPYKEQVMEYLDEIDDEAKKIGAVNVVKIQRNAKGEISKLKGYNSDIVGFTESIKAFLKPWHTRALILGTGGAAKAVYHGLKNLGIEPVYVSRTPGEGRFTYSDLTPEVMKEYTVIVNTTPLGMYPHIDECPAIPYECLTDRHLCYDLLYNPDVTLFMEKSAEHGVVTKNGLEMLLMQAFVSWNIWNQRR